VVAGWEETAIFINSEGCGECVEAAVGGRGAAAGDEFCVWEDFRFFMDAGWEDVAVGEGERTQDVVLLRNMQRGGGKSFHHREHKGYGDGKTNLGAGRDAGGTVGNSGWRRKAAASYFWWEPAPAGPGPLWNQPMDLGME
jgi:hypothetical protein